MQCTSGRMAAQYVGTGSANLSS